MKRNAFLLILVLLTVACATTSASSVESTQAERFRLMTANDLDSLSAMLADDLVYIHSDAVVEDKAGFLERMRSGGIRYRSISPVESKVRFDGNLAIVTGLAAVSVTLNGNDNRDVTLLYTAVYRNAGGRWLLASWQSTRKP